MKKLFIAAGALSLFTLCACSETETSGNTVEPNAVADLSSDSQSKNSSNSNATPQSYSMDFKVISEFTTMPTDHMINDTIEVSTYGDENAASGSCTSGQQELTGVVRIKDSLITRAYSGKNLKVDVDDLVYMFQKSCAHTYNDLMFIADTLTKTEDSFEYICVTESEYMSIDEVLGLFEGIMTTNCKELEIQDRLDSLDSAKAVNTTSIIEFSKEDTSTIVLDTSLRTLEAYAFQYAKPEELSFDSHVMAYKSSLSTECFKAMGLYQEGDGFISMGLSGNLTPIERDALPTCFPKSDSAIGFLTREASCKYYIVSSDDGGQPTGHVLTKVTADTVETLGIGPGGTCVRTSAFFTVYFLVEDCEDLISENTVVKHSGAISERWKCEEDESSPSLNAISYGEWYKGNL